MIAVGAPALEDVARHHGTRMQIADPHRNGATADPAYSHRCVALRRRAIPQLAATVLAPAEASGL
jgi:hypothetical protein